MKQRQDERSHMAVSIVASLLLHAAVIFLIPVVNPGAVVIYPVEFGEITQTFEAPREGSPEGAVGAEPRPEAGVGQVGSRQNGPETSVTVKRIAPPAEEPKPSPEPGPEPAPKQQAQPKAPPQAPPRPGPAPAPAGPASAAQDSEEVLTGKSGDELPVAPGGREPAASEPARPAEGVPGGGGTQSDTVSGASSGARETQSVAEQGGTSNPGGPGAGDAPIGSQEPAEPQKPRGEEFGTGKSLVLSGMPPVYPKNPLNEGVEGIVELAITVDAAGTASETRIVSGSGDYRLDEQAMKTISRGWRFQAIGWPYSLSVRITFRKKSVEVAFGGVSILGD